MKILMIQEIPDIRTIKTAFMLRDQGYQVDCISTVARTEERTDLLHYKPFNQEFHINSYLEILDKVNQYDIVHMHNGPDRLGALMLASNIPVIWGCHDLISSLEIPDPRGNDLIIEMLLYKNSHGSVFAAPGFENYCRDNYGKSKKENIITTFNYCCKQMIPEQLKFKKSLQDGAINVVYAGTISNKPGNHRYFYEDFIKLLQGTPSKVKLYVYPAISPTTHKGKGIGNINLPSLDIYKELTTRYQNRFFLFDPVSPFNLINEISQYDFGWMPFKGPEKFVNQFVPNKLYEYSHADLMVLTQPFKGIKEHAEGWENIIYYNDISEVDFENTSKYKKFPKIPLFESQFDLYQKLYNKAIE